jgi:hypothetical protein
MADTSIQRKAEEWIVENELPRLFGQRFSKRRLMLQWGGLFEVDAVSEDGKTAVCVSTSCYRTAGGNQATAKFQKIRADALYLLHVEGVEQRVLAFTDQGMVQQFEKARSAGRFPPADVIELRLVSLPECLETQLRAATCAASAEVSPHAQSSSR